MPVSIDSLCERFPHLLTARQGTTDNAKMCPSEVELRSKAVMCFEVIGSLLGRAIREKCPMGIQLPGLYIIFDCFTITNALCIMLSVVVWAMLLGEREFNWIDYCGDDKQLLRRFICLYI